MQGKAYYTYFNKPKLVFLLLNIYFIVDMSVLPGFLCTKYTSYIYRGQKREKELYFLKLQLPMAVSFHVEAEITDDYLWQSLFLLFNEVQHLDSTINCEKIFIWIFFPWIVLNLPR